jgi:hypothetical protein
MFLMAYYGSCALALPGKIYHNGIRHTKRAIGGSSSGSDKGYFGALPKSWSKT